MAGAQTVQTGSRDWQTGSTSQIKCKWSVVRGLCLVSPLCHSSIGEKARSRCLYRQNRSKPKTNTTPPSIRPSVRPPVRPSMWLSKVRQQPLTIDYSTPPHPPPLILDSTSPLTSKVVIKSTSTTVQTLGSHIQPYSTSPPFLTAR